MGQVSRAKDRKNGSEMIDCLAALPNRATCTWTATRGSSSRGWSGYRPALSGFGGSPPPLRSEGCGSDPLNIHSNPGPGPFPDPRQSFFVPLWFLRSSLPSSRPSPLSHRRSERLTVSVRERHQRISSLMGTLPFLTSSDVPPLRQCCHSQEPTSKRGPLTYLSRFLP